MEAQLEDEELRLTLSNPPRVTQLVTVRAKCERVGLCDCRECLLFPPSGPGCSSSSPCPQLSPLSLPGSLWVLSSKIYMADLESALHYILRIEVGKFSVLEGQRLVALKKFMAVLAQVSGALGPLIP